MAFTLDSVVPWGRSYDEYVRMFGLTDDDLSGRILGCGDGPAGFNAGGTANGADVVSCDPIYQFDADEIRSRFDKIYDEMIQQTLCDRDAFVWTEFGSPDGLGRARRQALESFLKDYPRGRQQGRYVTAALPELPFQDQEFDLALCSHFLFLYSDHLSEEFHVQSIIELARVAREVRLFPLLALGGVDSLHMAGAIEALHEARFSVERVGVPYEFVRGGNEMLRIRATRPLDDRTQ